MIELRMTAEQTRDYRGIGTISHASPFGALRIRAQRRANQDGQTVRIITHDGIPVCTVEPIGDDPLADLGNAFAMPHAPNDPDAHPLLDWVMGIAAIIASAAAAAILLFWAWSEMPK